jgi:uncharacterized protein (TIGR02118 family)
MVRFSVYYPSSDDTTFDHDYYRESHVPLCAKQWNPERVEIDKGINGPHVAAVHFFFDSQDALNAALGSEATGEIMADVANYTNVTPVTQISEVVS